MAQVADPSYWKVKAAYLALQHARLEAEIALAKLQASLHATMREAGLDPSGHYDLDDASETIRARTPLVFPRSDEGA